VEIALPGIASDVDTLVIGAGSSGAAVAGLLAIRSDGEILLVEAGPDYGDRSSGRWPAELLDASQLPLTHDWGYTSGTLYEDRVLGYERARVVGGCSSHNGCQAVVGHRADYDGWAAAGNVGWKCDEVRPYVEAALRALRVRQPTVSELTPYGSASYEAMLAAGIPAVSDLNDLEEATGVAPNPVNVVDGIRWNAAFAYIDPARQRPNFRIWGDTTCDRLILEGGRVVGAWVLTRNRPVMVRAARVVISAGTYGSPAVLLRSGIGDPDDLRAVGVEPRHQLPGVGRNLHDHPGIAVQFEGTPELETESRRFAEANRHPEEQLIAKLASSNCTEAFDLHLYTQGGARRSDPSTFIWEYMVAGMTPRSRGRLSLISSDPTVQPAIDHGYLSDPDGSDAGVLLEGLERLRDVTRQPSLARLLGRETSPGPGLGTGGGRGSGLERHVVTTFHPVGTVKMGPATDPEAVVDSDGRVHGIDGLYVVDASIMPMVPRANTNLPAVIVAERLVAKMS